MARQASRAKNRFLSSSRCHRMPSVRRKQLRISDWISWWIMVILVISLPAERMMEIWVRKVTQVVWTRSCGRLLTMGAMGQSIWTIIAAHWLRWLRNRCLRCRATCRIWGCNSRWIRGQGEAPVASVRYLRAKIYSGSFHSWSAFYHLRTAHYRSSKTFNSKCFNLSVTYDSSITVMSTYKPRIPWWEPS